MIETGSDKNLVMTFEFEPTAIFYIYCEWKITNSSTGASTGTARCGRYDSSVDKFHTVNAWYTYVPGRNPAEQHDGTVSRSTPSKDGLTWTVNVGIAGATFNVFYY